MSESGNILTSYDEAQTTLKTITDKYLTSNELRSVRNIIASDILSKQLTGSYDAKTLNKTFADIVTTIDIIAKK